MLESVAYLLWQAGAVGCLGVSLFLWRAGAVPSSLLGWTTRVAHALIAMTVLALVAGCVVLRADALRIFGQLPSIDAPLWRVLLSDTRLGQVWIVKQLVLLTLALGLYVGRHALHRALVPCVWLAVLFVVAGVWGGHGGVSEPLALFVPVHAVHGVLSAAWLGALPVWASLLARAGARTDEHLYLTRALQRHSRFALGAGDVAAFAEGPRQDDGASGVMTIQPSMRHEQGDGWTGQQAAACAAHRHFAKPRMAV